MSVSNITKTSYDSLISLKSTVKAFQDLVALMPQDDDLASLLAILSDRFESDSKVVESEIISLWKYVPDTQAQGKS